MKLLDIESLRDERPNLLQELERRGAVDVYQLNERPTGPDAEKAAKKTLLLLARRPGQSYIMMSTNARGGDKVVTWLHDEIAPGNYIVIDKNKVGRKPRELTEEERQHIQERHEAGESINAIAKALHLGTRRVMDALKGGA